MNPLPNNRGHNIPRGQPGSKWPTPEMVVREQAIHNDFIAGDSIKTLQTRYGRCAGFCRDVVKRIGGYATLKQARFARTLTTVAVGATKGCMTITAIEGSVLTVTCSCGEVMPFTTLAVWKTQEGVFCSKCRPKDHRPRFNDLTGQRFGRLVAVSYLKAYWTCDCDCGNTVSIYRPTLLKGRKDCGRKCPLKGIPYPH